MRNTIIAIAMFMLIAGIAHADNCIVSGYVFYNNGSAAPNQTSVRITNQGTGEIRTVQTGNGGSPINFYLRAFTCTHGNDNFLAFAYTGLFNGSNSGLATGLNLNLNITFTNVRPRWNASIPDQAVNEDGAAINNAVFLPSYSYDPDNGAVSYSIASQTNSGLIAASIDGNYIDIAAPAANQYGVNTVCVRSYDGEDYSVNDCFTITVNSVPDRPTMTSATDNVTSYIRGGVGVYITTVATDVDVEQLTLFVCTTNGADSGGCDAGQICTDTRLNNPRCTFASDTDTANHTWFAFIFDSSGRSATANYSQTFNTDSDAPSPGALTIDSGAAFHTTSTTLTFNWSGFSDLGSGIYRYYYNYTDESGTRAGDSVANNTFTSALTGAAQGINTVHVWAEDNVGLVGSAASDTIFVDTEAPQLLTHAKTPANLLSNWTDDVIVNITIDDLSAYLTPRMRYNYDGTWSAWFNMTAEGGDRFSAEITQPILGWDSLIGETLLYNISLEDVHGHTSSQVYSDGISRSNYAPVLADVTNKLYNEGINYTITLVAVDLDNDSLTFNVSGGNFTFVQLTDTTAIAYWRPGNHEIGSYAVTFSVTDGTDTDNDTILVEVVSSNDYPILSEVGDIYAYEHETYLEYIYGTDPDNENNYTLDNDILIFDKLQNKRWFRIFSFFNASSSTYYGIINFTPYSGQRGKHNFTIYVTDGSLIDSENITLTVGFCGDLDKGNEPYCDTDFEDCESCPTDCGECGEDTDERLAIIIDPRNCLERNFTIWTYETWSRATCPQEGKIIEGYEVCQNLSNTKLEVFMLKFGLWEKVEEYVSDDNGEITFVPTQEGEYKLLATKRPYPSAYEYLELGPCIKKGIIIDNETIKTNKTVVPPKKDDKPKEEEPEEPIIEEPTRINVILWYIVVPVIMILTIVISYYYYDNNKDKKAWLLKVRIWVYQNWKIFKARAKEGWERVKDYLGYGK
jgi:hypothetical protein